MTRSRDTLAAEGYQSTVYAKHTIPRTLDHGRRQTKDGVQLVPENVEDWDNIDMLNEITRISQ